MSLFNHLTFIVLTKNRHENLKKLIKYYCNTEIRVLIFDSSKKPINFNLSIFYNIKYFHTPDLNLEDRIAMSLCYLKTKFVAIHNDDDFYLKSTLKIALQHLEKNKNISAVGGRHYSFRTVNGNIYSDFLNFNLTKYKTNNNLTINFKNYLNNSDNTLVSIILRSSNLIKIEKLMKKYSLNKYFLREVFYAIAIFTQGKFKILNLPFFFRNENNYSYRFDDPANDINDNFFLWYKTTDKQNINRLIQDFYQIKGLKINKEAYKKIVKNFLEKLYNTIDDHPKTKLSYILFLKTKLYYFYNKWKARFVKKYQSKLNINFVLRNVNYSVDKSLINDFKKLKQLMW